MAVHCSVTFGFEKIDGEWIFVHEHRSEPVKFGK